MDRLAGVAEFLDGPLDDHAALDGNLRDLARINRWTGGTRLSERAIYALGGGALGGSATGAGATGAGATGVTILDVGTGGADIPMTLLARARAAGRPLTITATDSRPEILASARRVRPFIDRTAGLELAVADGRGLPTRTARSTSPTPRWSSTTSSPTTRSRSCVSSAASPVAGSSSTT